MSAKSFNKCLESYILFRNKYVSQFQTDEGRYEVMHGLPKDSKTPKVVVNRRKNGHFEKSKKKNINESGKHFFMIGS